MTTYSSQAGTRMRGSLDRRRLPLNALRAFEAVAKHGGFTAAAEALLLSRLGEVTLAMLSTDVPTTPKRLTGWARREVAGRLAPRAENDDDRAPFAVAAYISATLKVGFQGTHGGDHTDRDLAHHATR